CVSYFLFMNLDLTGRTAIVCGSTQGLGYASAIELALSGANVILVARNAEKLQSAVKTLSTSGRQVHGYLTADFSDPENVRTTIRAAVANWSKTLATELGPFGITVNNVLPGFTKTVRADYVIKKKAAESGKTEEEVMKALVAEIPAGRIGDPEEFGAAVAF